mmetsp:Transcript_13861/g.21854  ORF Transcript_13861/g.21854 Transcript_13861/m.21854 type:complete len:994 (+) Transcript_13861:149-3130(+)|eukprot:CAMPEP_0117029318 /NCGR_PEP_ID=MMETSP0472-20121206/21241_1 /TAXON_ID=693140 ORGANISM="Tiarina fusus, Strain LIS" /NCGR_SAMPLE_ID=MMETSP0472 /ASSEMBLY_ACC=CAM_ASM_000603 /LENGTH=993 /DNA_ID=CAMNT_0004737053 /DNA_START=141 /DNA_END=3122 /DNA_ORIENTATION=-
MSSSTFFHRPELALRRALELQGIHQSEAALQLLHEVLSSRRHRTWSPAYEQIMIAYLNLCLKLHKAREAKDGLHQYRNLAQSQAPGSLEKVIRYLLEKAEEQCSKAKATADAAANASDNATAMSTVLDSDTGDDDGIGPQAILLSTMSADPAKNQRDSLLVLPSLKFLWEIYRAVLDILRSNSKLEHVYHAASVGALKFCRVYQRRTEFRRLCDMLRMHLGNLQKYGDDSSSKSNSKVRGWEGWSTEAIELHLQTRFAQLETASVLHLYTEGFRTVEDIYNILQISHQRRKANPDLPPPKAKLMAKYYEQLTTLFWVSENHLFHAFAWYKYYALCKEYNKGMNAELKAEQASAVLLAALCIPSLPTKGESGSGGNGSSGTSRFDDSIMQEKMARMATLLGFHTRNPTRQALLEEITSRGIFEQAPPYLQKLYYLLENDSDPLVLVETAKPLLEQLSSSVSEESSLGRYVQPLRSVLLLKLLYNLSSAYHTVRMDFLKELTAGLGMTFEQVEKSIVLFTQTHKALVVRMDHRSGCLRFGDAQLESDTMRSQLTVLAQELDKVCNIVEPKSVDTTSRTAMYQSIRENRAADHTKMLERKTWIENRKEEMERLSQEKVRKEQQEAAAEEAARKAEEERRIQREQQLREREKQRKIQLEMDNTKKQQLLQAMGHNTDALSPEEMAKMDTAKLQKEHQDKINKKREEAERATREVAKRLDYLVRAIRIEELPLIKAKYEEKVQKDRERYEQEVVEKSKRAKLQWESDKKDKELLSGHAVFDYMKAFEDKVMEGRRLKHIVQCQEADQAAEIQAEREKIQRARKRKQDEEKRKAEEEERQKKEAEAAKAEEERRKKEEARREREAQEEQRRQAEAARMAEERERKDRQQEDRAPRGARGFDGANRGGGAGGSRYVPPSKRGADRYDDRGGGGRSDDRGGGSRFGGGGYPGGGRYDGRREGGRDGGRDGDRRDGGGYGDRRGYSDRRDGGGDGANSRWRR